MASEPTALVVIALTFLLAGAVKGVIGMGLPTVSLALLTVTLGLQPAMALLLVPSLATNIYQAFAGTHTSAAISRTWPLLVCAGLTVWIGALAWLYVDLSLLPVLLGVLLIIYAGLSLLKYRLSISRASERWAAPLVGVVNGVLTGMTGSFVVPGVLYLQALEMPRDMFVQAMGMLFAVSTLALGIALGRHQLLTIELGVISTAAVLPAVVGMMIGARVRHRISAVAFRRTIDVSLLLLGTYMVADLVR